MRGFIIRCDNGAITFKSGCYEVSKDIKKAIFFHDEEVANICMDDLKTKKEFKGRDLQVLFSIGG